MIVLDTNVISEIIRPAPAPQVMEWISSFPAQILYTTAITQAEMFYGMEILTTGKKKKALEAALIGTFEEDFHGRILGFDASCARYFAEICQARRAAGRTITQLDAQIAAIARRNKAYVATRNVDDFSECGVRVVNPWESKGL